MNPSSAASHRHHFCLPETDTNSYSVAPCHSCSSKLPNVLLEGRTHILQRRSLSGTMTPEAVADCGKLGRCGPSSGRSNRLLCYSCTCWPGVTTHHIDSMPSAQLPSSHQISLACPSACLAVPPYTRFCRCQLETCISAFAALALQDWISATFSAVRSSLLAILTAFPRVNPSSRSIFLCISAFPIPQTSYRLVVPACPSMKLKPFHYHCWPDNAR